MLIMIKVKYKLYISIYILLTLGFDRIDFLNKFKNIKFSTNKINRSFCSHKSPHFNNHWIINYKCS